MPSFYCFLNSLIKPTLNTKIVITFNWRNNRLTWMCVDLFVRQDWHEISKPYSAHKYSHSNRIKINLWWTYKYSDDLITLWIKFSTWSTRHIRNCIWKCIMQLKHLFSTYYVISSFYLIKKSLERNLTRIWANVLNLRVFDINSWKFSSTSY